MAMTVAALKRRITVGTRITMTQHWLNDCQSPRARPLPVTRAVVKVQGNAIVFEAWPGDDPSKVSWLYWPVAPVPAILAILVAWFFRDPRRTIPAEPGLVVSPADGKVVSRIVGELLKG